MTVFADAQLEVTFVDGTSGKVDMHDFLGKRNVDGTVFEPLREPTVFAEARVIMGAIQWPSGVDLAPDAMYDAIQQSGVWVLDLPAPQMWRRVRVNAPSTEGLDNSCTAQHARYAAKKAAYIAGS